MMLAYFDTNVFSNLLKREGGITAEHEAELRRAISTQRIVIPLSYLNLEETIAAPDDTRVAQISLLRQLVSSRFIKPVEQLLCDEVRYFAKTGRGGTSVWLRGEPLRLIRSHMDDVLLGSEPLDVLDRAISIRCARVDKERFRKLLLSIRKRVGPLVPESRRSGDLPTFDRFFNERAVEVAEFFADRASFEACRNRGISGLLKIRSIRMAVGVSLSLVYAAGVEHWQPKPSDSRDVLHATLAAAAADVFVTHDEPLREPLRRVPVNFRVLRLADLLDDVARPKHRRNNERSTTAASRTPPISHAAGRSTAAWAR